MKWHGDARFYHRERDRVHLRDRLQRMFPWAYGASAKHDYGRDYGWPEELAFQHFYRLYTRSGLAAAAVDKTIAKTWQTMPALWESEKPGDSAAEKAIAKHFAKKKIWRGLMDADRRQHGRELRGGHHPVARRQASSRAG
jgi:hypothetical protein